MKISSLGPVSRQPLKAAVTLGMILFPHQLHADQSASSDIFPKRGETFDRETMAPKLAERLSPCMTLTSNKSLPSGYGRIFVSESGEKPEIRLERSTSSNSEIAANHQKLKGRILLARMNSRMAGRPVL